MTRTDDDVDGPDGLHRFHRLLAAAYGLEIPAGDYQPVVVLLDELGLSLRGIVSLMRRFTRYPDGQLINDVNGLVSGEIAVDEQELSRVRAILAPHGYDELRASATPKWVRGVTDLDPNDPRISSGLRRYWTALVQVYPQGLQTPKDYVTALAVLRDEQLVPADIQAIVSALLERPAELIARDIDRLGSALVVSDEDKLALKRRLGLE